MRLENIKEEFPKMPDEIRNMIEDEVMKQLQTQEVCVTEDRTDNRNRRNGNGILDNENVFTKASSEILSNKRQMEKRSVERITMKKMSAKKLSVIFLAAALAVGTTAFAGSALYKMYHEKIGDYGLGTSIQIGEEGSTYGAVPEELEKVKIVNHYIPEGMIQPESDPGKMFYEETPYQGGVSMAYVTMDTKVTRDDVMMVDTNVKLSETMEISGYEAVYLEKNSWDTGKVWFDKKMYIIYPENWLVLEIFGGSDISKEEMIKVVENTELQPTGETYSVKDAFTWSEWVTPETVADDRALKVETKEISDIYEVGEEFEMLYDRYCGK